MKNIFYEQLNQEFKRILTQLSFSEKKAALCADIFASNSFDGVNSHGLNRFPAFVDSVKRELIHPDSEPEKKLQNGLLENWDGHGGPGMYNASVCTDRAIALAKSNGIGCVTVYNSNHWMRGGTYGWQAADAGCIGICFTNATAGMPPWGGKEPKLGNNPLVIAVPRPQGHVVLDMAMSQFSYGKMEEYELAHKTLPYPGGYDAQGQLTKQPELIRKLNTALPIGFWKGSGLALLLDIVLTAVSGGQSTADITPGSEETGVSQCFICIYQKDFHQELIERIIQYTQSSAPVEEDGQIYYPGERTLQIRQRHLEEGIPINEDIWNKVLNM